MFHQIDTEPALTQRRLKGRTVIDMVLAQAHGAGAGTRLITLFRTVWVLPLTPAPAHGTHPHLINFG